MKKKILLILRLVFSYFILGINILEILIKRKRIIDYIKKKNNKNICICYEGGFGVICQICDRLIKSDKSFSLILFFDNDRFHNRYFKNFFPKLDIFYLELFSYSYGLSGNFNQKNMNQKFILYLLIKKIIQFYSKKFNIYTGSVHDQISLKIRYNDPVLHSKPSHNSDLSSQIFQIAEEDRIETIGSINYQLTVVSSTNR